MGFHFQTDVQDWPRAVARLPAGAMVKAFSPEFLTQARAANPGVFTVMRYHHDDLQWYSNDWNQMVAKWRDIFPRFIDGTFLLHAASVNAIEEHNEYVDNSMGDDQLAPRINSARAALWVWKNDYQTKNPALAHIKLIICNAPVGNDMPIDYARLAIEYEAILGYHPYTLWEDGVRADYDWPYVSGRFDLLEDDWRQQGLDTSKLIWAFTEAGPFRGAWDGWRSAGCLGNNFELYLLALRYWIADMEREAEAYRQGRVVGFALFTCNRHAGDWEYYKLFQPELDRIADLLVEIWHPGQHPIPDPLPPPEPDPPLPAPFIDYVDELPTWQGSPYYPYLTRRLAEIPSIVIHHSVGLPTNPPESINLGHQRAPREYPRIGYHFYVTDDGAGHATVYKTNLLTTRSFHAGPDGNDGVGICIAGDFTSAHPTEAQLVATRALIDWLYDVLGDDTELLTHRDIVGTQCPGNTTDDWWHLLTEAPPVPGVDYVVTAILLPQQITRAEVGLILDQEFANKRTFVFSADDAARLVAPGLPGSTVIAYAPERWSETGDPMAIVRWLQQRGVQRIETRSIPQQTRPGGFDFPIGTPEERAAATDDWPGEWIDAAPYGVQYSYIANGVTYTAYHTGADLNCNRPSWNLDKGAPVYAIGDGTVTYARLTTGTWGKLVIIQHTRPDGSHAYSRYAHLGNYTVSVGDTVRRGQQIGNVGGAEYGLNDHLHFDISLTEELLNDPTDWPGMYYSRITRDYVKPLTFILENRA